MVSNLKANGKYLFSVIETLGASFAVFGFVVVSVQFGSSERKAAS